MWIVVTGGRNFADAKLVDETLTACGPTVVVQGGCTGADELARLWAKRNVIPCLTVWADWDRLGKSAGPRRNTAMLNLALRSAGANGVRVVAFPGNAGTAHCCEQAESKGLKVIRVGWTA